MTGRGLFLGMLVVVALVAASTFAYGADVARYHFDEGAGQTAADASGNGNTGQLGSTSGSDTDDPAWGTSGQAKFGDSCLIFTRSEGDWVSAADSNTLDLTSIVHIEAWIYPALGAASTQYVMWKGTTDTTSCNYYLSLQAVDDGFGNISGLMRFGLKDSGGNFRSCSSPAFDTANVWYFVSATYSSSTGAYRMHVNDTFTSGTLGPYALASNDQPLRIGRWSGSANAFDGRIDELVVADDYRPTAVDVAGLEAVRRGARVLISWETPTILDIFGFNVFRSDAAGKWTRVNEETIPVQWSDGRATYRVADALRGADAPAYALETIGLDGTTRRTPLDVR